MAARFAAEKEGLLERKMHKDAERAVSSSFLHFYPLFRVDFEMSDFMRGVKALKIADFRLIFKKTVLNGSFYRVCCAFLPCVFFHKAFGLSKIGLFSFSSRSKRIWENFRLLHKSCGKTNTTGLSFFFFQLHYLLSFDVKQVEKKNTRVTSSCMHRDAVTAAFRGISEKGKHETWLRMIKSASC